MHQRAAEKAIPGTYHELSCGCEIWNEALPGTTVTTVGNEVFWTPPEGTEFLHSPCSLDCQYVSYMIEKSHEQGKPVRYEEDRS